METLHAHWQPTDPFAGRVLFWLEQPSTSRARRRHPRAAKAPAIAARIDPEDRFAAELATASVDLLLPSDRAPLTLHDATAGAEFRPWRVPALSCGPEAAVGLLLATTEAHAAGHAHMELAPSFGYWHRATGLLLALLARQDVLPSIHDGAARWRAWPERQHDAFTALAEAMPPVCRAEARDAAETPRAADLLRSFLDAGVDTLARRWAGPIDRPQKGAVGSFLGALHGEPRIEAPKAQREWLAEKHRVWLRSLQPAGEGPLRVGFRLEAPDDATHPWTLHYLLQARDEPSLQVPAELVWEGDARLETLGARVAGARETLLAGLGYAARLSPPVRTSLDRPSPDCAELTADEAFAFLREAAPLLEESGFAVFVPPWWRKTRARLGVQVCMSSEQGGVGDGLLAMQRLVRYDWRVSVGGQAIDEDAFRALVALKTPLVYLRGEWVRLDPEQVERALDFFRRRHDEPAAGLLDALRLAGREGAEVDGLPLDSIESEGELSERLARLTGDTRLEPVPVPAGLRAELRPYQRDGLAWLAFLERLGLGACLADDMGLGKTVQTLALLQHLREEDRLGGPVLLVCPTSVVANWRAEAQRFTPGLRVLEHHGSDRLTGEALTAALDETDLVLTSYALARRDGSSLAGVRWRGVVLDEAQNIKNPHTKGSRALFGLTADFRLALTGTPVENRLSELWSIMRFLNPGYLGSLEQYRKTLARPIERHGDETALTTLRRLVGPLVLRRSKRDPQVIADLPDKLEQRVDCSLTAEQASLYQAVVRDAMEQIEASEGIGRRGLVLSMLTQLKQICNHPAHYLHEERPGAPNRSGKLERFLELLEEALAEGDAGLVFTQYRQMGDLLVRAISDRLGTEPLYLHGGTPASKRAGMVETFQRRHGPPVFVLSLKAGGTGLNLTRASHVFHFDRWWNPAVEAQATDRAYRIGQEQHVHVHTLVSSGTVEERIDELMRRKQELADKVLTGSEAGLSELDSDALRQLVTLRGEVLAA